MSDEPQAGAPPGVVALFQNERGQTIATAADFDRSGWGGFTTDRAQTHRVRGALARAVINAYAGPDLARAIDTDLAVRITERLTNQHGCKVALIRVGHGEPTP